jgi:anti-anti-sigma regulatory factor
MLKIRRSHEKGLAVFALSGRINHELVPEVRNILTAETDIGNVTLDLEELRIVDREAVKFLDACEVCGIKLANCPSYIREWIHTGRNRL